MAEETNAGRLLRVHGLPVREALQKEFAFPVGHWAQRVEAVLSESAAAVNTMGRACPIDRLDYATASYFVDLFDDCGSDGMPVSFETEVAVDEHMARYWPNHVRRYCDLTGITPRPADTPYSNYGSWKELHQRVISASARKKLTHTLKANLGQKLDPAEWRAYQAADAAARQRKGPYTLGVNAADMCAKDRLLFPPDLRRGTETLLAGMPGKNKSFLVAGNVALSSMGIANIRVPIGEYGEELARSLVATTWLAAHFIQYDAAYSEEARNITGSNPELYATHTMRAYGHAPNGAPARPVELGMIASHQEGNLAAISSLGAMTNTRIPGREEGHATVEWLMQHNMVTKLSKVAALNFIATTVHGAYYPGVVEDIDGAPRFAEEFIELNNEAHALHEPQFADVKKKIHEENMQPNSLSPPLVARTGLRGCSLAYAPKSYEIDPPLRKGAHVAVVTRHAQVWSRLFTVVRQPPTETDSADRDPPENVPIAVAQYCENAKFLR